MTSDMAFECLLVSRDTGVVSVMNRLLDNLSIATNICLSSSEAFDRLVEGSTDLVIVDWEDDSAEFVNRMRKFRGWQKPTLVAVSPENCPVRGADVIVRKPVTAESGAKSLRAAYSRMLCDHRRYTRYPVMSSVNATDDEGWSGTVMVTDIGDGGVGLKTNREMTVGDVLSFRLMLPENDRAVHIQARVQWTRKYDAAGCEFLRISAGDLKILNDWLTRKNQIKKPAVEMSPMC